MTPTAQRRPRQGAAANDYVCENEMENDLTGRGSHASSFAATDPAVTWRVARGVKPLLAPTVASLAGLGGLQR
jgi:hypothetical protein